MKPVTYTVDFDNAHVMSFYPEEKHAERRRIDNAQAIRLSDFKWESRIFVETREVCRVLRIVNESGI